jgi:signal transduction histidine kinase
VKVTADQLPEDLPEDHKTCVYRVVQEALHNCVQHAGAGRVEIAVNQRDGCLRLSIQDDGKGLDAGRQRGMGLLGIEERVGHLGGRFTIESAPGQGALLRVDLPVPPPQPAAPAQPAREIA